MSNLEKCDKSYIRDRIIQTIAELNGEPCVTDIGVLCDHVALEEHEWQELEEEFDIIFTSMGTQLMIKYDGLPETDTRPDAHCRHSFSPRLPTKSNNQEQKHRRSTNGNS